MANYLIHACLNRLRYVYDYLIPSLQAQGIENVDVRCDTKHLGCLESCMSIFDSMESEGGTWHLQDDVIVCHNFKELTERYDSGIVCGFTQTRSTKIGLVKPHHMWWSFPCIRIPNEIAKGCAQWYYSFAQYYAKYYEWVEMKKCDDNFLREYLIKEHPDKAVLNLAPNLVDHIDWLIGGSIVNDYRGDYQVRAQYFEDRYLVDELEMDLKGKTM